MKILQINSSVRGEWSVSKNLATLMADTLKEKYPNSTFDYLDLASNIPSHPSAEFIVANYTPSNERTPEMVSALKESDALVEKLQDANIYIIGVPMYNFSIPSIFKAFIDNVVRINITFKMTTDGIEGFLKDKKVFLINTRGVDFNHPHMEPMDQLKPYLKVVFGFIGITDINFIDVSPVQFSDHAGRDAAINKAKEEIFNAIDKL